MMKKLLTAVLSAAAIAVPFFFFVYTAPQTEQSAVQPEKAKGVWIDVRSAEEFKNAPINLYCRSGRRAEAALPELKNAGYTNVTNHGGYEDLVKKGLK